MAFKEELKRFWDWVWNSNSFLSLIVFLILLFIFMKFIFLPVLGLIFNAGSFPLAIVESSSMDHRALKESGGSIKLCGNVFPSEKSFSFEEYWNLCGGWYEERNISEEQFKDFKFSRGFSKGDVIILWGWKKPEIGDVLVFKSNSPTPIIHRVVSLAPLGTKGDHNPGQLTGGNSISGIDETNIPEYKIIAVAVAKIPYVGWVKLFAVEHTFWFIVIAIIVFSPFFVDYKKLLGIKERLKNSANKAIR